MQVGVVALAEGSVHDVAVTVPTDACPWEVVLFVPLPRLVSTAEIDQSLNRLPEQSRITAEAVLLRAHPHDVARLLGDEDLREDLRRRFPDREAGVLHFAGGYQI